MPKTPARTAGYKRVLRCLTPRTQFAWVGVVCAAATVANAQQGPLRSREFRRGTLQRLEDLPASRMRSRLERLPVGARQRAIEHLKKFHFTEEDLKSLEADDDGAILYVDHFVHEGEAAAEAEPAVAKAAVAAAPFPSALILHSRPGAPNVLFLNFSGENVTNTAWNSSYGKAMIPAVGFSTDGDYSTFSDSEQLAIKRIWQRVAEDFAPFNIDVTTERPASFGNRTAHALITRNTDADGAPTPASSAGGVAYVNVFGTTSNLRYSPAWIYYNNLGNSESSIAEAASHEIGHNLGLSHDGKTSGAEYYGGHGSGETSWGPIMGTGYGRNVSQWSRGEYYLANNTQDDLATIATKLSFRTDDHSGSTSSATALVVTGTNILVTTPENDPANASPFNKGVLERNTDTDVFSFQTGSGLIRLAVKPWVNAAGTRGGDADLSIELRDANGSVLASDNPAAATGAQIQTALSDGTYYLFVRNSSVGDPLSSAPTGYTSYGSLGQYFISGFVSAATAGATQVQLAAGVNNPEWGSVNPTNGSYPAGNTVQLLATARPYYQFVGWSNGASGSVNPLTLSLQTNIFVTAVFGELLTMNHPTPHRWLTTHGYTTDLENAVNVIGANGLPLWQSYLAGLNPTVATDSLRVSLTPPAGKTSTILKWNSVSGRTYTLWWSTNVGSGFTIVPGASNLPASVSSYTNTVGSAKAFYRVEVRKP